MRGRLHWLAALLMVVALLGAACGGDDTTDNGTTAPATTDATDEPTDDPTDEPAGDSTIALEDFVFNPADPTVASGSTVTLDNTGEAPHTFTISDEGIDEEVAAGESSEVTIDLDPGTYDFVCTFHEAQGMVGTLTVE